LLELADSLEAEILLTEILGAGSMSALGRSLLLRDFGEVGENVCVVGNVLTTRRSEEPSEL
jgi:hypothetical protein